MIPRILVVGVGNPDRGDDGAGRQVARRIRERVGPDVDVAELSGEATELLARLGSAPQAVIVDACVSGARPGSVRRFDIGQDRLPASRGLSSHGFGLAEALQLGAALGQLPARCIVYAIEGVCFEVGAPLSEPVARAVQEVVEKVSHELGRKGGCTAPPCEDD